MTSTLAAGIRMVGAAFAAFLMVACGSAPVVRNQQVGAAPAEKISRVIFFYQEVNLTVTSTQSSGKGNVTTSVGETGFYHFGEAMVAQAAPAFLKSGVTVAHASVVPPGESRLSARKTLSELGPGALNGATVITVSPRGGQARATIRAGTVAMTFEVRVIDASSARTMWVGAIDTSTWNGRDFLVKNVDGPRFNEAYAARFLEAVLAALKGNNLL